MVLLFLGPTLVLLGVWIVYPTIRTIIRSFYDRSGDEFVGLDNYETLFTDDTLLTAIKNNFLWLLIVPVFVTAIGLVFAVLLERIRFSVAFKVVVFMPMAISLFAAGVIWRLMYEKDPSQGTANAAIAVVKDAVSPSGALASGRPSTENLQPASSGALVLEMPLEPGAVAQLGLTGIRTSDVPAEAVQAVVPEPLAGGITGVVWRDFKPGGGEPGVVEQEELGLPGVTVELRDENGRALFETTTEPNGTFAFDDVQAGPVPGGDRGGDVLPALRGRLVARRGPDHARDHDGLHLGLGRLLDGRDRRRPRRHPARPARGGAHGRRLRVAGLPAGHRPVAGSRAHGRLRHHADLRPQGVRHRDLVAPGSVQDDANVIALAMWRTSFGGVNDFGLGAAIAVFLFLLVIPILVLNIRRFRREV